MSSYEDCQGFTKKLKEAYKKLKEKGENFEVVFISLDQEEQEFIDNFVNMPWLALPFKDKNCERLARYFELRAIPTMVVIGTDGEMLHANVADLIEEYGEEAYPFTPERIAELEKAKEESQTLESILVSADKDYVISKDGSQVMILTFFQLKFD